MSVARITEISATSDKGFADGQQGTKEQEVEIGGDGRITSWNVNMVITFVLE